MRGLLSQLIVFDYRLSLYAELWYVDVQLQFLSVNVRKCLASYAQAANSNKLFKTGCSSSLFLSILLGRNTIITSE